MLNAGFWGELEPALGDADGGDDGEEEGVEVAEVGYLKTGIEEFLAQFA